MELSGVVGFAGLIFTIFFGFCKIVSSLGVLRFLDLVPVVSTSPLPFEFALTFANSSGVGGFDVSDVLMFVIFVM